MNPPNDERHLADSLVRDEARLIQQEHRPRAALRNFLARKQWPAGDPRRRACWLALIWAWFGPTAVALGAVATLVALIWQNRLMAHQLNTMDRQFISAEKANREAERTQLIGVLWDVKEVGLITKKTVPVASARTRKEALLRFVEFERERFRENGDAESWIDLSGAQLSDIVAPGLDLGDMSRIWLKGADLRRADLSRARFDGANLESAHLEGASLRYAHLDEANLISARLEGAALTGAHLEGAFFWQARLDGADLSDALLGGADFSGAHLEGADLSFARFDEANLYEAQLEGALVGEAHPSWLDENEWTTVAIEGHLFVSRWEIRRREPTPPVGGGP